MSHFFAVPLASQIATLHIRNDTSEPPTTPNSRNERLLKMDGWKLSEDNWRSTFRKKQHMIKEIRLSIHYLLNSSFLLPFQLVFHLILLIFSFNPSIFPSPLPTSSLSLISSFLMLTLLLLSCLVFPTCYSSLLFLRLKPNLL